MGTQLLLASIQKHTHAFWSDMLAFQEIVNNFPEAIGIANDHLNIHEFYLPNHHVRGDPFDLKEYCTNTESKTTVHFSHYSCELAKFCYNNRGPVLTKWLEAWRNQCLMNSSALLKAIANVNHA